MGSAKGTQTQTKDTVPAVFVLHMFSNLEIWVENISAFEARLTWLYKPTYTRFFE